MSQVASSLATRRRTAIGHLWLFAGVLIAQTGHLIEHISMAVRGQAFLGPAADSELSHLLFNGLIAILSVALVRAYPRNPWVYPLLVLALFHGVEHVYIYSQYLKTSVSNGPGLLGLGGAIGIIPLDRLDLHNVYNGLEVILMALGFWHEADVRLSESAREE